MILFSIHQVNLCKAVVLRVWDQILARFVFKKKALAKTLI